MKRLASVALVLLTVMLTAAAPGYARERDGGRGERHHDGQHHHSQHHDFDRGLRRHVIWSGGPSFYFGAAYAPPPYSYEPAPVYAQAPTTYWTFCRSAGAYYPDVTTCAEPWVAVPATR
jgi:hypothetical protein